ncbi:transcriptional activator RinB [Staphylococcus kloosii]|jgi:hypothetical protein|uniref:transcriptional activator RinB n=1 Tax=Staphylococcus kloosii TaxID=29384 RepID=UPI001E470370|nr:transcriptional activator RinB [Staphylococcus kloosii]
MTKYMMKPPFNISIGDRAEGPGKVYEIKKLKHPVILGGKKHKYIEVNTQHFMNRKFIKQHFTKGAYKSEYPKRLLYILSLLTVYELSKYVTNEIIIRLTANDEIDAPRDYDINSQADLNGVHNYNVGGK